jgi:quercetin dioxygenase-like cupin family protein
MAFADRLELPLRFDPVRLYGDLKALQVVAWTPHFVQQNYEGDWSVLALRAPADAVHPIMMITSSPGVTDYKDTPLLRDTPYFREVLHSFECPLQAVRLMRLKPGSVIKEHRDHDLAFETGTARLHIPVITNSEVDFRLCGRRVTMEPGSVWYLRLSEPHSVVNAGATDRVHLVIDAQSNDWLQALLARGTPH